MHDRLEGVTHQGTIRTGARRSAIASTYGPILSAAVDAVAAQPALYVYGSVATGAAKAPMSDVDLLSVGLPVEQADRISGDLSARFRDRCRAVSIAAATWETFHSDDDEGYGLRVFVRHYCVHLAGPNPAADLPAYAADARAARGFNGDIARYAKRWRSEVDDGAEVGDLGVRIARKTLLAVAGLVSARNGVWSTDRRACAVKWNESEPAARVDELLTWLDNLPRDRAAIHRVLQGPVARVVEAFESEIGLWSDGSSM